MKEVIVVCEGQTEETFVRDNVAPDLARQGVFLLPRLIATSPGQRGGALSEQRVMRYLRNTLRERNDAYVTTFFDLYALPREFPGLEASSRTFDPLARARIVEEALHEKVVRVADCRPERFFPHIQPYEFESLLFANISMLADEFPQCKSQVESLRQLRLKSSTPEHINDGVDTHPSKRIEEATNCNYRKVLHGSRMVQRIGIDRIRSECAHFGQWFRRIEQLTGLTDSK